MSSNEGTTPPHWFLERNPLLDGIPNFPDTQTFLEHLSFSPLAGLDLTQLSLMDRFCLLTGEKTPLVPTTQSLRAAMTWYGMFRVGLQARNPLRAEARRRYWEVLNAVATDVSSLPRSPTPGIAVQITKGPTGTAKTVTAKRFCAMMGRQYIDRDACPEAGWNALRQLVYLYTDLSHDGTRGGFLSGLLTQVDHVLGTNYASDLPKRLKTLDRLAVATVGRLIAHYTGIVFIDEGQLRNLMLSDQAELIQMFLLALMNSGIPLVLIGNECAFDWIDYSQDQTRLNTVPPEYFHPVGAIDNTTTDEDRASLHQGISEFYLLNQPPAEPEKCKAVLEQCSGGIARLGLMLWTSSQLNVLSLGGDRLCPDDILAAYSDPSFDKLRPLADGFARRLPELLLGFPDVAAHYYARCWGKPLAQATSQPQPAASNNAEKPASSRGKPTAHRAPTGPARLKAEQTRKRTKAAARATLEKNLDPNDMRRDGIKAVALQGLAATKARIDAANPT